MASIDATAPNDVPRSLRDRSLTLLRALPISRIAAISILGGIGFAAWYSLYDPIIILALTPLALGSILMVLQWDKLTLPVNDWKLSFDARNQKASAKQGKFSKYFLRPLWGGARGIWNQSERIRYPHTRAAVRLTAVLYYFGLMIALFGAVAYAAVIIVVFLAVMLFGLWLVGKFLSRDEDGDYVPVYRESPVSSRKVEGLTGTRIEHYAKDGHKLSESRERDGIFGKYTEHTDVQGRKTGESRNREGIFGSYVEHTDANHDKVGESREREGVFGDYTEHQDTEGRKTGESRFREGVFGDYVEHDGSHPAIGNNFCNKCGEPLLPKARFCTGCGLPSS